MGEKLLVALDLGGSCGRCLVLDADTGRTSAVVEAMGDGWAVLMGNHGLVVAGRSVRRAADMAEIIERTAEVIVKCHAVGRVPSVLPPEAVKALAEMGDRMA